MNDSSHPEPEPKDEKLWRSCTACSKRAVEANISTWRHTTRIAETVPVWRAFSLVGKHEHGRGSSMIKEIIDEEFWREVKIFMDLDVLDVDVEA
jgi:hypothetical protein